MNILFLAHRIPYPPDKGDKIRSFNEIRYLSKKHSIYLVTTMDQASESIYVSELEHFCRAVYAVYFNRRLRLFKSLVSNLPFTVASFYDNTLQGHVNRLLKEEKIAAIICFCSGMAEYVFRSPLYRRGRMGDVKLIMDFVDLDSDKWRQYARYTRYPKSMIYWLESKRLFDYERKINRQFDHSIFVSQREVTVLKNLYPASRNTHVITNGVDYSYFTSKPSTLCLTPVRPGASSPSHPHIAPTSLPRMPLAPCPMPQGPMLLFTGVMDYFANEDGVRWFCEQIFPRIREVLPQVEFYIVGNRPSNVVWSLSEIDGVTVAGYVPDIRYYYWMATVCVIPLRIARGLQNKLLEAMATGNAVVATSNASDGIICHHDVDIVIADDEKYFAGEVVRLLSDNDRRMRLAANAILNVKEHYTWDMNLKHFEEILA